MRLLVDQSILRSLIYITFYFLFLHFS
ncbi:hypothetical protein CY0110_16127 [Crocosphaera chwakensis CCY0110]|uniref:Uncharacterized protein n=1 Tax=Crocosphaera chwakensis CCY0110 TaxID=391612 RepID=A3IHQ7_9CHRO|nr:hypothetical protein CY0110_16127 [Crocosphaera chwakensis CCY0110]